MGPPCGRTQYSSQKHTRRVSETSLVAQPPSAVQRRAHHIRVTGRREGRRCIDLLSGIHVLKYVKSFTANLGTSHLDGGCGFGHLHPWHDCANNVFIIILCWKLVYLQSADVAETFLCRSCLCHRPPQTCSSWRGGMIKERRGDRGGTINHRGSHCASTQGLRQEPKLTPLCLCAAGALAFLSGASCGNGWSRASPAARPNQRLYKTRGRGVDAQM